MTEKYNNEDIDIFMKQYKDRLDKLVKCARDLSEKQGDTSLDNVDDYTLMKVLIEQLDLIKREAQ